MVFSDIKEGIASRIFITEFLSELIKSFNLSPPLLIIINYNPSLSVKAEQNRLLYKIAPPPKHLIKFYIHWIMLSNYFYKKYRFFNRMVLGISKITYGMKLQGITSVWKEELPLKKCSNFERFFGYSYHIRALKVTLITFIMGHRKRGKVKLGYFTIYRVSQLNLPVHTTVLCTMNQ